jgi:hypothetical protein
MTIPALEPAPASPEGPGIQDREALPAARSTTPAGRFRTVYWLAVPALAILAYATALRVGFLGDDFVLLRQVETIPLGFDALLPRADWVFYRPVGWLLAWVFGWDIWGFNPLPYHLVGLLLHAGTSLVLGVWLAEVSRRRWLGLLGGALFAVFPLHIEAVGWLAAQWDLWAVFFGVLSLWLFTRWWREGGTRRYALSLIFYALGIFSKESLLAWLPVFALSAWLVTPRAADRKWWRRIVFSLAPFVAVLAFNLGLRLLVWGNIGGYTEVPTGLSVPFEDTFVGYLQVLISPLNPAVFGNALPQVVGIVAGGLIFLGLLWYGYRERRLLLLAAAWVLLALAPVLNLPLLASDLQQNRFTYLPAAGYCVLIAVLLYQAALSLRRTRLRMLAPAAIGVLLALGVAASWLHLRPWHTATVQANEVVQELNRLIPPQGQWQGLVWDATNIPDTYEGAYLFRMGLGELRYFTAGDDPWVNRVDDAAKVDVTAGGGDTFAMRFFYSQSAERFHVNYLAGFSSDSTPPTSQGPDTGFKLWDFTDCSSGAIEQWQTAGAAVGCDHSKGMVVTPLGTDPQMIGPALSLKPADVGARFVRLRVAASYPQGTKEGTVTQWFWQEPGQDWSPERIKTMNVKADGRMHVYWTFLPASDVKRALSRLRLDPANASNPVTISWIAVDLVK